MKNASMKRLLSAAACCLAALVAGCGGGDQAATPMASASGPAAAWRAPVESMTLGSPLDPQAVAPPVVRRAAPGGSRVALDRLPTGPLRIAKPDQPRRIGFGRDIPDTARAASTRARLAWRPTPGGGHVGQIVFESPGAQGLRLGILVERLPAAAVFRFHAPSAAATLQVPATEILDTLRRNRDSGDEPAAARLYWSPQVSGAEVALEVELPPGADPASVALSVPRLSHLFRTPQAAADGENTPRAIGDAAYCGVDVSCHPYTAESNATARMSYVGPDGGSFWCTGTLLNDRASSGTPYFLTANHCIAGQTVASTLETYWFFRSTACNSRTLNPGYRVVRGGATLLYASAATDTAFLRLAGTPPPGATYTAWSPEAPPAGIAVAGVHHPRGDLQKISFGSITAFGDCRVTDPSSGTFSCTDASQSTGEFLNVRNTMGTTEGGSSGSALFRTIGSSRYLVGQLYGGNASCSNSGGSNFYGRFDVAYQAALHQWLDGGSSTTLSVSLAGSGQGAVTSAPVGISCGATCSAPFAAGASVTLAAVPAPGSTFAGWSGACSGAGACVVGLSSARSVVASFAAQEAGWVDHVLFVPDSGAVDRNRVFNWAEVAYPAYFKGSATVGTYQDYTYRYYPKTGNYLAVRGGRVVVHNGGTWNFLDVGSLGEYLMSASAAGF